MDDYKVQTNSIKATSCELRKHADGIADEDDSAKVRYCTYVIDKMADEIREICDNN